MFHAPNEHRIRTHPVMGTDDSIGNNGAFRTIFDGYEVLMIASDGLGWEHVSVTINRNRTPSWEVMQHVKTLFWDAEDCVLQFHPPESVYVNCHPNCLHLWRAVDKTGKPLQQIIPPPELVGVAKPKEINLGLS